MVCPVVWVNEYCLIGESYPRDRTQTKMCWRVMVCPILVGFWPRGTPCAPYSTDAIMYGTVLCVSPALNWLVGCKMPDQATVPDGCGRWRTPYGSPRSPSTPAD